MEIISLQDKQNLEDQYPGWPTEHNDFLETVCYPHIKPSIKPEFREINTIYHYCSCKNAKKAICIHHMKDGTLQKHKPHPVGKCSFCDYQKEDQEAT